MFRNSRWWHQAFGLSSHITEMKFIAAKTTAQTCKRKNADMKVIVDKILTEWDVVGERPLELDSQLASSKTQCEATKRDWQITHAQYWHSMWTYNLLTRKVANSGLCCEKMARHWRKGLVIIKLLPQKLRNGVVSLHAHVSDISRKEI